MGRGWFPIPRRARRLADAAAIACLQGAGRAATEIDVLVNVGVYRDKNLAEPALVALVQEDIRANPGHPPLGGHGTFSFDVDNGACGALTAMHLADGFVQSGAARLGMVVASDSPPGLRHGTFPYEPMGAALILKHDREMPGFTDFRFATFPEHAQLCEGYFEWVPRRHARDDHTGHTRLVVKERSGYRDVALECASSVVEKLLADNGVAPTDVDLVLATHSPGFSEALAKNLGVSERSVVQSGAPFERAHTAAMPAAIGDAIARGRWQRARTALLVSAGAGLTVGCALHRR